MVSEGDQVISCWLRPFALLDNQSTTGNYVSYEETENNTAQGLKE